jgi:hypothetical protein
MLTCGEVGGQSEEITHLKRKAPQIARLFIIVLFLKLLRILECLPYIELG